MIYEVLQEILKLKRDSAFVRNLVMTNLVALVCCLCMGNVYHSPRRSSELEKVEEFSHKISAGMVIRTYQIFLR
ncbi:hypothetical protein [Myxosarcina sp. GI1(2024)]